MMRPNWKPNPYGHLVKPDVLLTTDNVKQNHVEEITAPREVKLTAYLEPTDQRQWQIKPLPPRRSTKDDLHKREFPGLSSCSRLPEQWPVDDYPEDDPFLPWIHDVFPTHDGKFIQFVAQNKNRCHTGTTEAEEDILEKMRPQTALFEHVPLKRVDDGNDDSPRFRLSSHEEADPESIATRFICRFKPSGDITFSEFNNDYEWVSYVKGQRRMFDEEGRDIKQLHTSQLLFKCPVPDHLIESIRLGNSIVDDWATLFLDIIPVRTPPRYGPPKDFLAPKWQIPNTFTQNVEWGHN